MALRATAALRANSSVLSSSVSASRYGCSLSNFTNSVNVRFFSRLRKNSNYCLAVNSKDISSIRKISVSATADVTSPPAVHENTSETSGGGHKSHGSGEKLTWRASIDFRSIRENREEMKRNVEHRKTNADVDKVVELYDEFVQKTMEVDKLRAERNAVANSMKGKLDPEKRLKLVEEGKRLKDVLAVLEHNLTSLTDDLQREGQRVPNTTHPSVPIGGEELAVLRKEVGTKRDFTFPAKDHVELGLALDLFDFDAASEVSGTKFYYLKREAVLLEMALINWAMSELVKRGFVPLATPDLVRSSVLEKCGFQPRAANTQVYSVEGMDLCLAGTAEILVGGLHMDKILSEAELPLRLVAFSHCFRTEAGAAGAATRGLYRVHQFSKVEIFALCTPEESEALHEELITIEEELFASLGLHFKTLDMSSEDLGAPAYRKYDVEAWMPGLGRYGEISSASNCTDYQARRLNIRYRPAVSTKEEDAQSGEKSEKSAKKSKGKPNQMPTRFVHTLNATACAVPRMIISIFENFQQEDGSIVIPEPLRPYMGGMTEIRSRKT